MSYLDKVVWICLPTIEICIQYKLTLADIAKVNVWVADHQCLNLLSLVIKLVSNLRKDNDFSPGIFISQMKLTMNPWLKKCSFDCTFNIASKIGYSFTCVNLFYTTKSVWPVEMVYFINHNTCIICLSISFRSLHVNGEPEKFNYAND
jgi:hypothetical protein